MTTITPPDTLPTRPVCGRRGLPTMGGEREPGFGRIARNAARNAAAALAFGAGVVALAAGGQADSATTGVRADPRLRAVLQRFDEAQSATRTLSAAFTERKEISLLEAPVVSRGRFYFTKPNDVLWEYTEPDRRYFLINKDELLSYHPARRKASRLSLALIHDRLLKVLGLGQTSAALGKYYDIRLLDPDPTVPGTQVLLLTPRRKSVQKRIQDVRFWVSDANGLPVRMQYRQPEGDTTTIAFEHLRINPEIAAGVYRLEIPADVPIEKGAPRAGESRGGTGG